MAFEEKLHGEEVSPYFRKRTDDVLDSRDSVTIEKISNIHVTNSPHFWNFTTWLWSLHDWKLPWTVFK